MPEGFVDNDARQNRAAPGMIAPKFGDYCCAYAALAFFCDQNCLRFRNIIVEANQLDMPTWFSMLAMRSSAWSIS
jgi:hypothetical protein